MAKYVIEFDSVEKTLAVSVDGQEIPDAHMVYAGLRPHYDGEGMRDGVRAFIEINRVQEDRDNKTHTWTRICAEDSGAGTSGAPASGAGAKLANDIDDYFDRPKRGRAPGRGR